MCLSRNRGEKILIGDSLVEVLEVSKGGKVRLGVTAPKNVEVWRTELLGPDGKPASPRRSKEPAVALKGGLD